MYSVAWFSHNANNWALSLASMFARLGGLSARRACWSFCVWVPVNVKILDWVVIWLR